MIWIAPPWAPGSYPPPASTHSYLAQDVDVVIVVLVLLLLLVLEYQLLLGIVDCWFEDLVGPLVLPTPVVVLILVLEVVVPDVGVPVANANVDSLVLEHPRHFPQHLLRILLRVCSTLHPTTHTRMESRVPLSITQSKV